VANALSEMLAESLIVRQFDDRPADDFRIVKKTAILEQGLVCGQSDGQWGFGENFLIKFVFSNDIQRGEVVRRVAIPLEGSTSYVGAGGETTGLGETVNEISAIDAQNMAILAEHKRGSADEWIPTIEVLRVEAVRSDR